MSDEPTEPATRDAPEVERTGDAPEVDQAGDGQEVERPSDGRESSAIDSSPDQPTASDGAGLIGADSSGRDATRYLYWAAFLALSLLAVVALFQFYLSASTAIRQWVADAYRPIFVAGFNLFVLLAAVLGISLVVRRLSR